MRSGRGRFRDGAPVLIAAGALVATLIATPVSLRAETPFIQPGQWTVTTRTTVNGAAQPPAARPRCFTPQQASDIAKTFGPQFGTVNSNCEDPVLETTAGTLSWRLVCRGQLDMDVRANFDFDSATHYTATVTSQNMIAGALVSDVKTEIEGERTGECAQ